MKKLLLIFFCLGELLFLTLPGFVWADWKPADFQTWQNTDTATVFRQRIGGVLANYQKDDSSWAGIENNFSLSGDTLVYNLKDLIKTAIRRNGLCGVKVTWQGVDYIITQKMKKLIWLKTDTWNWVDVVDSVVWSNPSVDSNIVKWTNVFPGVDYRIQKQNGILAHGIFFKKAFLDSAVKLYNQRPDSLTIALGNVIEYDLVNVDDADSAIGNVEWRQLKNFGKYVFELTRQTVQFPGSDTLPELPVKQRWVKQAGKLYCVEYMMMSRIKQIHTAYPNAQIWHNNTTKISGTTNVEDGSISNWSYYPNYDFGGSLYMWTASDTRTIIRVKNVGTLLGADATITACVCSAYCYNNAADGTVSAYRIFKPWVEGSKVGSECLSNGPGGATYNDWICTGSEWTTAGCNCAGDDGSDNSTDNGTCGVTTRDRKSTAEGSTSVTTVNTWYGWSVSTALAQAWYNGTAVENGIILIEPSTGNNYYRTTEYTTDATKCPFWTFTYDVGAAGDKSTERRIRNLRSGIK